MIFDEKKSLDFYRSLGIEGRYTEAVDFPKGTDLEALEPGKYGIDGKNAYADVTAYTIIPQEEAKYGAHEHCTDVRYVIGGSKIMSYAPVHEVTVKAPYNLDKDAVLFENITPELQVVTDAGQYLIFNPWDAHKPKAANGEPAPIRKVAVKTRKD